MNTIFDSYAVNYVRNTKKANTLNLNDLIALFELLSNNNITLDITIPKYDIYYQVSNYAFEILFRHNHLEVMHRYNIFLRMIKEFKLELFTYEIDNAIILINKYLYTQITDLTRRKLIFLFQFALLNNQNFFVALIKAVIADYSIENIVNLVTSFCHNTYSNFSGFLEKAKHQEIKNFNNVQVSDKLVFVRCHYVVFTYINLYEYHNFSCETLDLPDDIKKGFDNSLKK